VIRIAQVHVLQGGNNGFTKQANTRSSTPKAQPTLGLFSLVFTIEQPSEVRGCIMRE